MFYVKLAGCMHDAGLFELPRSLTKAPPVFWKQRDSYGLLHFDHLALIRRGQHESRILAGYYGFNANNSFTFQVVKNLSIHPRYLCFELLCKCFGDFYVYLEINRFSERISKIYGNGKF